MSKILCIPDFHQDLPFVQKILDKELNKVDKIIFLGDEFDSFDPKSTIKEVCLFLNKLQLDLKEKLIFLKGNHSLCYYFHYERASKLKKLESEYNHFYCSGYTKSKAYDIGKYLSREFIENTKLAHFEDGVLYTHAGARPELFKIKDGKYNVQGFLKECERLNKSWKFEPLHPFLSIGQSRGGCSEFGGLTWCDEKREFKTCEELPFQCFGHTPQYDYPKLTNKYCCLDVGQTYYAIIQNGQIEIKTN